MALTSEKEAQQVNGSAAEDGSHAEAEVSVQVVKT